MKLRPPIHMPSLLAGVAGALAARVALSRLLLAKFRRDVAALNEGDYGSILSAYSEDAVLTFADGDHRWAGQHHGKEALERFFKNFVAARIRGDIRELYVAGPPWRLTLIVRFDDRAEDDDRGEIYRNRTVVLVRTRWGRVVEQEDFYENTERIAAFEARLRELGIAPIGD